MCFILKGFILDPNLFLPIINTHNKKKTPDAQQRRMFFPVYKILSSPKKTPGRGAAV